jgi:hypothetical protein
MGRSALVHPIFQHLINTQFLSTQNVFCAFLSSRNVRCAPDGDTVP